MWRLESRITGIAIQLGLSAEFQHRESAIRRHQWRVERKTQLEEEQRERKRTAERAERERRKRLETGADRAPPEGHLSISASRSNKEVRRSNPNVTLK